MAVLVMSWVGTALDVAYAFGPLAGCIRYTRRSPRTDAAAGKEQFVPIAALPPFYFKPGTQTTMPIQCQRLRRGMLSVFQRSKVRCFARKTIWPTW